MSVHSHAVRARYRQAVIGRGATQRQAEMIRGSARRLETAREIREAVRAQRAVDTEARVMLARHRWM